MKTLISRLSLAALLISFEATASFDGDGLRLVSPTPVPADGSLAQALALGPDGRFYVSGYSTSNSNPDTKNFYILRFNADGSTSPGFEVSEQHSGSISQSERSLLVQADGKLIAAITLANSLSPTDSYTHIRRFETNSQPDSSFARFEFDASMNADSLNVLALQADGRILAAGSRASLNGDGERVGVIARLHDNGSLDTDFGQDGYVHIGPQASRTFFQLTYPQVSISSVNLLEDGRIAVAGTAASSFASDSEILLARYLSDGTPDPDFNNGQPLLHAVRVGNNAGRRNGLSSADTSPEGTWLVSVQTSAGGSSQACLLEFNPAATLIAQRCESVGSGGFLSDVQLLPNGGVVAAGAFGTSPLSALFAAYPQGLNATGGYDPAFSSPLFRSLSVLAYDPDRNRVVVAGQGVEQVSGQNRSRWLIGQLSVPAIDVRPDFFDFGSQVDVAPEQTVMSGAVQIGGLDERVRAPFRVLNGDAQIAGVSVASGRLGFVTPSGMPPRIGVTLMHTAAATDNTETRTSFTLGGVVRSHNHALTVGTSETGMLISRTAAAGAGSAGALRFVSPASTRVEEGQTASLMVERLNNSSGAISVEYVVRDAQNQVVDSGSLIWADGESVRKTLSLTTLDDTDVNGLRTFVATLLNPQGGATLAAPASGTLEVTDNDAPVSVMQGVIRLQSSTLSVREGESAEIVIERINGLDGNVRVTYETVAGTASDGDFDPLTGSVSWINNEGGERRLLVATEDNDRVDGARTVVFRLLMVTEGGASLGDPSEVVITLTDDDAVNESEPEPTDVETLMLDGGQHVKIAVFEGTLSNVRSLPASSPLPSGLDYPLPLIGFGIGGVTMGATVQVALDLPAGIAADTYVKCTGTSCAVFEGARFDNGRVILTLTDGGAGDADGMANGFIDDPGTVALRQPARRSGGAFSIWLAALMLGVACRFRRV